MKKSYSKNNYKLLTRKLCDNPPDSLYITAVSYTLMNLKYKSLLFKPNNKSPGNAWSIFLENQGGEFVELLVSLARISSVFFYID